MKLCTKDYDGYDLLPEWQQVKILNAIEKRLRKVERQAKKQ